LCDWKRRDTNSFCVSKWTTFLQFVGGKFISLISEDLPRDETKSKNFGGFMGNETKGGFNNMSGRSTSQIASAMEGGSLATMKNQQIGTICELFDKCEVQNLSSNEPLEG
jgi:hypothetical protein